MWHSMPRGKAASATNQKCMKRRAGPLNKELNVQPISIPQRDIEANGRKNTNGTNDFPSFFNQCSTPSSIGIASINFSPAAHQSANSRCAPASLPMYPGQPL